MGILGDIINRKVQSIVDQRVNEQQRDELKITTYNRVWLDKVANHYGYAISDNDQKVDNILKALNKRDGHCPCGGMTEVYICPCQMMREHGACKCGLYMNAKDIQPTGLKSTARIKE